MTDEKWEERHGWNSWTSTFGGGLLQEDHSRINETPIRKFPSAVLAREAMTVIELSIETEHETNASVRIPGFT